jgi:predicted AlkP superfamily pyrophosphatase or phosphodiesterase
MESQDPIVRLPSDVGRSILLKIVTIVVLPGIFDSLGEPLPARVESTAARHVVVVVWDGMRPDLITPENAPTLYHLAEQGVHFTNHHAVYLSATHVNGTAIETGMYPEHTGVIANYDYRPEIEKQKFISTEQQKVIQKGDSLSHGKYVSVPTLAELVRRSGGRTAVVSAKTVGFLLDRQPDHPGNHDITLSSGESLPESALRGITAKAGSFPGFPMYAHAQRDEWSTAALTEKLWKDEVPAFSLLWLGEPDLTQHETAPGAPAALHAIKSSDRNLSALLDALDRKGVRSATDVFVVSDHGFSTIERAIDVQKYLLDAGIHAVVELGSTPKRGDVMLVGNGGTVLFYVIGHDPGLTSRLIERLQQSDFAGVILSSHQNEGTFPLSQVQLETAKGPDVVMSFKWSGDKNEFGVPGMIQADWNRRSGKGTHATLSRFDLHNTLIAAGPDFRAGFKDDWPTGNVDLAPTIVQILNLKGAQRMDGRVLSEAMVNGTEAPAPLTEKIEASRELPMGTWRQVLQQSRVGSTIYLDEGNGGFTKKP